MSDTGSTRRDSRKVNNICTFISTGHVDQALVPPELPFYCYQSHTFLDCDPISFLAQKPFLCSGFKGLLHEDSAPPVVLIGRLQRLRASQQDAFKEREFFDTRMSKEAVEDKKLPG